MADTFDLAAEAEAYRKRKSAGSEGGEPPPIDLAGEAEAYRSRTKVSEPGAPATVQEQIAIGVRPYEVDTNFYAEEGELWKAAREYGVQTGEANPDEYATRLVMEKRRNVNNQDETDLISPFFVEAATKKVKDSTEPGGLPWRAADAFGMRQYGEPTPKTSEVGWKVATTEHEREVGRALLYKNLMDSGVPESEAKVKSWAAWERGDELQVPTRKNVTLSASPMVDPKVVDPKLRDDLKQAGTDMLSGLAETARDAANVAKDFSVDVYLAGGEIIPRATGTMTWWADTSKRWRDAAFPSPTKAAADWLAQSDNENLRGFAERLKYAHDRDTSGAANFATGMAEMNNALNDALGGPDWIPFIGLTRVDPSQPGILNALASIPMSAPKHTVELPVPSAEEMAQHEKDAAVQYANQLHGSWSAFLQGDLEGSAAVAEAMQTGGGALSLVTTPVMDAFMIASRTPDPTERETALGWFFRTVPSASFNLGSVWIARAADYAARKSGAESWRQNRVPTGEAPTAAEALVPFWSGSYWHDWLTAVRNGDSLTPEFMRFADTMAYGMPGLSDEQRVRWMGTVGDEKAGAYRYYGTNLAMAADLIVPMDRAPHIAWGGVESAGRFHEVYGQARQIMAGTPDGGNRALQTATATVAPSLTHQYLMRSDPEYRAAWDAVEQQSVRAQEDALAGQGRPLDEVVRNVTPDIDSVRLAVARAWARKAVESGYNPAAIDPSAPRVARDIANAYREYLTTLRIGKEGEDGTVATTPDGEPPHVNEPATVQALVRLGYDPDVARTMPEADANARIAERRGPDGSESPPEPVRDDALHAVVDEVDGLYTVAVDENIPALGKWSDITLSEADPVKRLALMRAEVEQHIGAPFDTITGQLPLQSALSFVDPKTGQYVRAPRLTPDALTQYAPADIEFALNRLLNATPEQVWRNAGTFERGGVAKWVDEGPVTRERVSLALKEAIRNKAIDATEQDVAAFMAVQDRVAQRLTDIGVVKSPSEWWSQAEHHLGSIREQGARGAIEFGKTGAAIVTLAKTANLSTLFHENAHALRRILPAEHMKALDGFVAETYGGWDVRAEEWFARQFESVLRTGGIIPKSAPPTWTERLTAALRYAADVLRSIYRDGELPEVHPIFRQWMDEFIVGGGKVAPVDGGGLAVPKPEPAVKTVKPTRKKETVRARPGEPTMPAAARDGWSPKVLEDFARKADEVRSIKDAAAQNKAVQAWLSAIHAVIGEDVGIRAKRHRLAGGIGTKILDMMLNAGRQIVDGMTPEARSTADAAYTGKAGVGAKTEPTAPPAPPVSKSETTAPAPSAPAPVTTPKPKSPGRALAEGIDARRKALESVSSSVRQLHAAADAGDVKATVAAIKGVTDAVTAAKATVTPEAKKAFIGAVKAATKGADVSVAVRAATEAYLNAAGMGMPADAVSSVRPNPAVPPQLPDVLLPTPAPTPIPLHQEAAAVVYARPLPSGGTDTINQYGLKRVVVGKGGNVDVTVATVDINSVIAPDVDVAFTATFDPLLGSSVLGLDVNTGSPVLAMVDSTYTPVTGAKRLAAMKELHRRGLAGEEPYATRLAALQNHMSSAAMAMGIQQPKPGEVLVRVVGSNPKVTKSVSGVANKGAVTIPVDSPAWSVVPPEVTHAAWASTADVVRQVADLPYSVDMPDALARVVADGIALYSESVRSGQSIRAAAERMADHYVAAKNAKALAVSDASVAVADAVANGRLVEHVKSMDVESVAVEHEMAVDHARRLEMAGIEHNIKNTVMPTEPPGYGPVKKLLQHTDHISPMAPRDPLTGDTLPVPQGDVGVIPGKDAPSRFSAEVEGQDSVISPAGQKLARGRAIPLLSREEINLALGYRADQLVYPARELAERVLAQALVARLQASESRMAYEPISNRISVPKQRAAAVRARAMVILGDTPEIIVKAGERRPADVGVIADESPPLNLTPQEAGKVLLVLDYLRHTGWSESLPKSVRAMDINDLQTRFTTTDYRAIVNAVHDSVSGAAPYRADISRYSLARNIVWKLAQRPDGVFTPQPLETTAGWGAKVVNQARSIIGATILTGANFFLPFDTIPSMRPDIRPAWERARRELLSSAAELAEAVTTAVETVGAKKGAMVDALVRVSAASKGWRTLVDVMPRDNGPSDLTRLRRWLYNGDPEHARQNALGTYDYVPHDLPRTVEDKSRGIVARPITDAPAEVYAHADVVERVLLSMPRSVDALRMRLMERIRSKTLAPEEATAVIGLMHVIINECAQTGVNALTAAAGHSGMKDHVKKVLEGTASKRGLALDAYEALFTYRWSDEPVQGVQPVPPAGKPATPAVFASIESMVRMLALSIGKENVRLRTDLWVFDVINRLNAEEIKHRLIDELVDLDYAHDLSTMADAAGHTFGSLAEEVRFAEEVKRAVNYEMWGTNYTRETRVMQDENGNPVVVTTGRGNVEVNVKEEHISPEAMAAARVIIAKTGIRPDVLTTRKGYKGELSSAPVGSRLVSLMNDPTRMLERANDPTTWRSEGSLFTSRGRDVYLPDTVLKSLDEAIEMAAPLTERLAATLSERQLPVGVFRRVEDAFRQLKGSLITGGRSGYLTTAAFAVPILGGAHVLDAATLALGVHALSYLPRSMGYVTNAMGAVMQGVMELGVFRSADAVGRRGRMAYRAMQDTIRFRKMGTFVDGARAATLAVMEKATGAGRGAESVMFTTQNGHVYSLADVVRIGRDYGLDGTQARVESAAKTQVALDALYKKYDREPGVVGKLWSEITSFYERDALTENYRRMYEAVDTFFRYVWLLDGLDKGLPVHEAVSRSLRISFDYTAVAPVDRLVNFVYMFWMYQRRAIDLTVAAMIENPTGVNGLIRFMRAQDLTSGYSDLDEDYVRQSETVPDYAMARPAIDVWRVAGSKSSHMKQLFSEPPVAAATKMISDVATGDVVGLASRAQPQYLYIINLLNGMVGGDYIDFFRKEAKEGESSAAPVSPVFVRMDQALTGGKFQNVLGYHMRYEGDPMRQPAPGAPYTFDVPGNKRVVWDAMNMIPGFANLLGNMDIHDRSDTYVDSVLEEYLRLLGSPMEVPPDSVVYPAPNQTPRPNVGLDNERDRFLGFTPAVIATPYAARARALAMTKEALAEELRKKIAEIRRMKEAEVDQGDVMGPSELTPDRNIGIDPNKPMGVEK